MEERSVMRKRVYHPTGGPVLTKQADTERANINAIVRRFVRTGELPVGRQEPRYGDFSDGLTFHDMMCRVRAAEADFMMLPSAIRAACSNDAAEFLDALSDKERLAELQELGLPEWAVPHTPILDYGVRTDTTEVSGGKEKESGVQEESATEGEPKAVPARSEGA